MEISIETLRALCDSGSIRWTLHVLQRMMQRGISRADVIHAIQTGAIIEQYPDDYPFPSCLILGSNMAGNTVHVVCGRGPDDLWIITAYYPDPSEWEADYKTRRQAQ